MIQKKIDRTGMARMEDLKQENNSQDKKQSKKEKKKAEKTEKLDRKKEKILNNTKKTEKIHQYQDTDNVANAKAISSFSKGHSTYTLR